MNKLLNYIVIIAIILNFKILIEGTNVYNSFYINFNYIIGALWFWN